MSTSTASLPPPEETREFLHRRWEAEVLPALARYIAIPAKSPAFDPEWSAHGHIDNAIALVEDWSRRRPIEGLAVQTFRLPGRTPILLAETPGAAPETILLCSNAHGPNEFLHLPFAERLTACVADLIAAHHRARRP